MMDEDEARARLLAALDPVGEGESVPLEEALGRVLADNIVARRTQPPCDLSAMDGYAVRADDACPGARLRVIGVSAAGHPFSGRVGTGEAVRIFTGAAVPPGADAILIQEHARCEGKSILVEQKVARGRHIRRAGSDFVEGDPVLAAGLRLAPRHLALAAAADHAILPVSRRPRVKIFATGDELRPPGQAAGKHAIVDCNSPALAGMLAAVGADIRARAILPDDEEAIRQLAAAAEGADLLVTIGGVSVGDRDLVRRLFPGYGFKTHFWRIAIKPGKPLLFGHVGEVPLIGLPGNPVSALVTARLFVVPALLRLQGVPAADCMPRPLMARLEEDLPANGSRRSYLRAITGWAGGMATVKPLPVQDSAHLRSLARADVLIRREPHAPPATAGEMVAILPL
ncbi:MAG: molybdopterin molybdenumtransferase MoeA, partial [Alphaproteobacteria bacterium]